MNLPGFYNTEIFEKMNVTREHRMTLESGEITFFSCVEDHVFYDGNGAPEAVISTISYLKKDGGERPVMFFWNGGPGSATSALHLECFGPYQMERDAPGNPTGELTEDAACLLDCCDLVFVDPVGVGFSRLLKEDCREKYWSLTGDARSNAFALVDWIRTHRRWKSPLYLCGESYGTVRVCRMLDELGRDPFRGNRMMLGIRVSGVILIGLALSVDGTGSVIDDRLELLTAALPSMAAVHWYHNLRGKEELQTFVDESWKFALRELMPVLPEREYCPREQLEKLAERIAYFTGMPASCFVDSRLSLGSMEDFMTRVAAGKQCRVDLYDGRKTTPLAGSYNVVGNDNVPLRIMNGDLAGRLGTGTDRLYYTGNLNVGDGWDMRDTDAHTGIVCLREAMERMPDMRVLTASGLFDLCTLVGNTRYLLSHSGLPEHGLMMREYAGGHGVYSSEEGKREFLKDVRELLNGSR